MVALALTVLSVPAVLAAAYLGVLMAFSRRVPPPAPVRPRLRFEIVVPAHDEAGGIARTVASARAVDWPAELFRVLVVADNCSDDTAARAEAAGATVLVRQDATRRGKGYALAHAFQHVLAEGRADAVVVIDADTAVSPGLLASFAACLEGGAAVVQAHNGVLNPDASWRTRLMTIAFALAGELRSRGRQRLRVSCGLRGNGMCFSAAALRRVPYGAFSLVEDVEYGIHLAAAGIRVWYAPEARVMSEMVSGGAASRSQRRRWEEGRAASARQHARPLLRRAWTARDPVALDLALDLLVPPLARVAVYTAGGTLLAGAAAWRLGAPPLTLAPWLACCAVLAAYVLRGVQLSGLGLRGLAALAWAPVYVLWKLLLVLPSGRSGAWVRTQRAGSGDVAKRPPAAP